MCRRLEMESMVGVMLDTCIMMCPRTALRQRALAPEKGREEWDTTPCIANQGPMIECS